MDDKEKKELWDQLCGKLSDGLDKVRRSVSDEDSDDFLSGLFGKVSGGLEKLHRAVGEHFEENAAEKESVDDSVDDSVDESVDDSVDDSVDEEMSEEPLSGIEFLKKALESRMKAEEASNSESKAESKSEEKSESDSETTAEPKSEIFDAETREAFRDSLREGFHYWKQAMEERIAEKASKSDVQKDAEPPSGLDRLKQAAVEAAMRLKMEQLKKAEGDTEKTEESESSFEEKIAELKSKFMEPQAESDEGKSDEEEGSGVGEALVGLITNFCNRLTERLEKLNDELDEQLESLKGDSDESPKASETPKVDIEAIEKANATDDFEGVGRDPATENMPDEPVEAFYLRVLADCKKMKISIGEAAAMKDHAMRFDAGRFVWMNADDKEVMSTSSFEDAVFYVLERIVRDYVTSDCTANIDLYRKRWRFDVPFFIEKVECERAIQKLAMIYRGKRLYDYITTRTQVLNAGVGAEKWVFDEGRMVFVLK